MWWSNTGVEMMNAVSVGNGQLHQMGMTETANALDCMHDAQAILVKRNTETEGGDGMNGAKSVVRRLTPT